MSTVEGSIVLTQDDSSGTVHKRVRVGKSLATFEGDNLDAAGAFTILPNGIGDARQPFRLCLRCFPPDDTADDGAAPV